MRLLKALAVPFLFALALFSAAPASADTNCSGYNSNSTPLVMTAQVQATIHSVDFVNCRTRGAIFIVDLTTMTAATVTVTIEGKDAASGKYYTLLAGSAKTATGTTQMTVYPDVTASSNVAINSPLPATWRVTVVIANNSGTAAVTGTIGASVLN